MLVFVCEHCNALEMVVCEYFRVCPLCVCVCVSVCPVCAFSSSVFKRSKEESEICRLALNAS